MTFVFKDDKTRETKRYCWNSRSTKKEPVMKAEKEETTWLLDVAGKGRVKASVQVPVKGIKD